MTQTSPPAVTFSELYPELPMSVPDRTFESKVILIGRTTVGKTCIVNAALTDTFSVTTQATVGAGFSIKVYESDGNRYTFQVWDTAGHERFRSMTPLYYRGAGFALIVFAVDDRQSFDEIEWWKQSLTDGLTTPVSVILVANKTDLESERVIFEAEGEMKAKEIQAQYIEVSAKTGAGIDGIFKMMAEDLHQNFQRIARVRSSSLSSSEAAEQKCC
jgi:small GTP-binding protein